eukprot:CAMPEP_0197078110 /NCGR_PEP_ID=MMETSP1384-20130603/212957_1 /TAXON_ID=29189 /ORGANISM="Ammonia sp." /LENGTH=139 /DNA_ID=CAMNT_0042516975 /DNA_START=594 /DNA_END=1013 /DNA_ORIENTATION=+
MYATALAQAHRCFDFLLSQRDTLQIQALQIFDHTRVYYHSLKHYLSECDLDHIAKNVYMAMLSVYRFILYTHEQCHQIMPYAVRLLPSTLDSAVVHQFCAILIIGCSVLFALSVLFMVTWMWYRNMIDQYMHHKLAKVH